MNTPQSSPHTTAFIDPLVSRCVDVSAIAEIAMGRADTSAVGGPHLALLGADALDLDLADPAQRSFGDYELVEKIGEGGMGVVYRAHQSSLDRDVAVKLLAAGPWASREFIERFQREAQNAARMQHPNIVAIHEVGSHDELHFFSMRLVQGGSLATLLQREGKLDPRRAATLLRTIAEAVDYAHRLGVLHLDLKPANVLLDDNGNPHVADFGLARRLEQGLAADNHEISGTPSYMAPNKPSPARRRSPRLPMCGAWARSATNSLPGNRHFWPIPHRTRSSSSHPHRCASHASWNRICRAIWPRSSKNAWPAIRRCATQARANWPTIWAVFSLVTRSRHGR